MPMDGFTLSFLERELRRQLVGGRVDRLAQPERDAVVLTVRATATHRLLLSANPSQARAQLTRQTYENPAEPPMFCMLMRKHLSGARIRDIRQIAGDRILTLVFDCLDEMGDPVQKTLTLELMGRHSNLILTDGRGTILDAIRHVNAEMSRVRTVLPGGVYRLPPQPDKLAPDELTASAIEQRLAPLSSLTLPKALATCVSGMAAVCAREVCLQVGADPDVPLSALALDALAPRLAGFFAQAPSMAAPVVLYDDAGQALDFFAFPYASYQGAPQKPMPSLSEAMDAFYLGRDLRLRMQQRGAGLQKHIKSALERTEKKKAIMLDTLRQSDRTVQNRVFGDLLTAHLYELPKGAASVTLPNDYEPGSPEVVIPLSPMLTPSQNAQSYYKKYRKSRLAEQYARQQLTGIERDLTILESALDDLEKCQTNADLSEIRQALTESGFLRPDASGRKAKKPAQGKPYRFVSETGVVIEVGKNSLQNDRLTLHARGNETWLHAQNLPGSHVIIRTEEEPDDATLLLAGKLAAYFSKGRQHPQLAVDYTRRKYVKKAPNAPAGFVTYTHFKTLIIGLSPQDMAALQRLSQS